MSLDAVVEAAMVASSEEADRREAATREQMGELRAHVAELTGVWRIRRRSCLGWRSPARRWPTGERTPRKGPKARAEWLTASAEHDAGDVVSAAFARAEVRDPQRQRCWLVLVDGAGHTSWSGSRQKLTAGASPSTSSPSRGQRIRRHTEAVGGRAGLWLAHAPPPGPRRHDPLLTAAKP